MRLPIVCTAAFVATACSLAADATIGADAPFGEPTASPVPGTEQWSLRPDYAGPITPRAQVLPISRMREERRSVRIVYYGYGEANLIKSDR